MSNELSAFRRTCGRLQRGFIGGPHQLLSSEAGDEGKFFHAGGMAVGASAETADGMGLERSGTSSADKPACRQGRSADRPPSARLANACEGSACKGGACLLRLLTHCFLPIDGRPMPRHLGWEQR